MWILAFIGPIRRPIGHEGQEEKLIELGVGQNLFAKCAFVQNSRYLRLATSFGKSCSRTDVRAVGFGSPLEPGAREEHGVNYVEDHCDGLRGQALRGLGQSDDSSLLPDWFARLKGPEPERGTDRELTVIWHLVRGNPCSNPLTMHEEVQLGPHQQFPESEPPHLACATAQLRDRGR